MPTTYTIGTSRIRGRGRPWALWGSLCLLGDCRQWRFRTPLTGQDPLSPLSSKCPTLEGSALDLLAPLHPHFNCAGAPPHLQALLLRLRTATGAIVLFPMSDLKRIEVFFTAYTGLCEEPTKSCSFPSLPARCDPCHANGFGDRKSVV